MNLFDGTWEELVMKIRNNKKALLLIFVVPILIYYTLGWRLHSDSHDNYNRELVENPSLFSGIVHSGRPFIEVYSNVNLHSISLISQCFRQNKRILTSVGQSRQPESDRSIYIQLASKDLVYEFLFYWKDGYKSAYVMQEERFVLPTSTFRVINRPSNFGILTGECFNAFLTSLNFENNNQ